MLASGIPAQLLRRNVRAGVCHGWHTTKRGFVPMTGNPRRAVRRDSSTTHELIAVSDSNVTALLDRGP